MSTHRTTVGRPLPRADRGLTELRISVTLGKQPMSAADQQERVPVPDGTRGRVWSEFHDAVRYSRYFNQKASDMASIHRAVLIAHAVLAAGVLTVLLGKPSIGFIAVGCSLGIAALSIWLLLSNYAEKLATDLADEIALPNTLGRNGDLYNRSRRCHVEIGRDRADLFTGGRLVPSCGLRDRRDPECTECEPGLRRVAESLCARHSQSKFGHFHLLLRSPSLPYRLDRHHHLYPNAPNRAKGSALDQRRPLHAAPPRGYAC